MIGKSVKAASHHSPHPVAHVYIPLIIVFTKPPTSQPSQLHRVIVSVIMSPLLHLQITTVPLHPPALQLNH